MKTKTARYIHTRPPESVYFVESLVPHHRPTPGRKLEKKTIPCTPLKAEATDPPPFLPISSAQESDCSPSALTRFH